MGLMEDTERLEWDFANASSNLRKIVGGKAGSGVEKTYGEAYAALVRVGLKPKLRRKYT